MKVLGTPPPPPHLCMKPIWSFSEKGLIFYMEAITHPLQAPVWKGWGLYTIAGTSVERVGGYIPLLAPVWKGWGAMYHCWHQCGKDGGLYTIAGTSVERVGGW